jgi:hypothetical protein
MKAYTDDKPTAFIQVELGSVSTTFVVFLMSRAEQIEIVDRGAVLLVSGTCGWSRTAKVCFVTVMIPVWHEYRFFAVGIYIHSSRLNTRYKWPRFWLANIMV